MIVIFGFFNNLKRDKNIVYAPLDGKVIALEKVDDSTFSQSLMGDGIAIEPESSCLKSPVNGVIKMIFPTKHALGIKADNGTELLIHIGIDTVDLKGKFFHCFVKVNDKVIVGQSLIEFDMDKIKEAGYPCTTMIIITNSKDYDLEKTKDTHVQARNELIKLNEKL